MVTKWRIIISILFVLNSAFAEYAVNHTKQDIINSVTEFIKTAFFTAETAMSGRWQTTSDKLSDHLLTVDNKEDALKATAGISNGYINMFRTVFNSLRANIKYKFDQAAIEIDATDGTDKLEDTKKIIATWTQTTDLKMSEGIASLKKTFQTYNEKVGAAFDSFTKKIITKQQLADRKTHIKQETTIDATEKYENLLGELFVDTKGGLAKFTKVYGGATPALPKTPDKPAPKPTGPIDPNAVITKKLMLERAVKKIHAVITGEVKIARDYLETSIVDLRKLLQIARFKKDKQIVLGRTDVSNGDLFEKLDTSILDFINGVSDAVNETEAELEDHGDASHKEDVSKILNAWTSSVFQIAKAAKQTWNTRLTEYNQNISVAFDSFIKKEISYSDLGKTYTQITDNFSETVFIRLNALLEKFLTETVKLENDFAKLFVNPDDVDDSDDGGKARRAILDKAIFEITGIIDSKSKYAVELLHGLFSELRKLLASGRLKNNKDVVLSKTNLVDGDLFTPISNGLMEFVFEIMEKFYDAETAIDKHDKTDHTEKVQKVLDDWRDDLKTLAHASKDNWNRRLGIYNDKLVALFDSYKSKDSKIKITYKDFVKKSNELTDELENGTNENLVKLLKEVRDRTLEAEEQFKDAFNTTDDDGDNADDDDIIDGTPKEIIDHTLTSVDEIFEEAVRTIKSARDDMFSTLEDLTADSVDKRDAKIVLVKTNLEDGDLFDALDDSFADSLEKVAQKFLAASRKIDKADSSSDHKKIIATLLNDWSATISEDVLASQTKSDAVMNNFNKGLVKLLGGSLRADKIKKYMDAQVKDTENQLISVFDDVIEKIRKTIKPIKDNFAKAFADVIDNGSATDSDL